MTAQDGELFMRKDSGLVRDVFQQKHMLKLKGNIGIGHVRYPTAGADSAHDAQPFYVNSPYGICLGHNGNLTNARELTEGAGARGPSAPKHRARFRSPAQRPGVRARARRTPRVTPADVLQRPRGVSTMPRRILRSPPW